ncbi:hypothetical protein TNCV_4952231 [Trichonephila clavipes]|nr:hypothetical protein TNCV_4952231 [Trichonephila clavipes]
MLGPKFSTTGQSRSLASFHTPTLPLRTPVVPVWGREGFPLKILNCAYSGSSGPLDTGLVSLDWPVPWLAGGPDHMWGPDHSATWGAHEGHYAYHCSLLPTDAIRSHGRVGEGD